MNDNIVDIDEYKKIRKPRLDDVEKLLSTSSDTTRAFQSKVANSSENAVAFGTSIRAREAAERIDRVDRRHLSRSDRPSIGRVTAKSCGATISKEATIRKNQRQRRYTAKRQAVRRKIAAFLVSFMLLGVGGTIADNINEYHNLSATGNPQNGYEVLVSTSTQNRLRDIGAAIEQFKSLGLADPPASALGEIRDALDYVYDDIMYDLVKKAFEERNKNCTVTAVETKYDKTANQYLSSSASEPNPEYFCTISYTDEKGNHEKTVIRFDKDITESFDKEYTLDRISSQLYMSTDGNVILEELEDVYNHANHLAGTAFEFHRGLLDSSLEAKTPKRINDQSINDPEK